MRTLMRFALPLAMAGAFSPMALATPADLDIIKEQCGTQLNMPPAACSCVVGKAAALNDNQQAFAAAVLSKDDARRDQLAPGMSPAELKQVGIFMTSAQSACSSR